VFVLAMLWNSAAHAQAISTPVQSENSQFDGQFRCPESLADDAARDREIAGYVDWAAKQHPNWTSKEVIANRYRLLTLHHCTATLNTISRNASLAGGKDRFACPAGDIRMFFPSGGPGCKPLPLEKGWENFMADPSMIVDVNPNSIVRDKNTVKLWVRFYMNVATAYVSADGIDYGTYDSTKGVWKFFCGNRQQTIVQADYLLGDRPIYHRPSNEAIVEEIKPGTISDFLYQKYCGSR